MSDRGEIIELREVEVRYWVGARYGEGRIGKTRSSAFVLGGHTAVVQIADVPGCVALTHVEVVKP